MTRFVISLVVTLLDAPSPVWSVTALLSPRNQEASAELKPTAAVCRMPRLGGM